MPDDKPTEVFNTLMRQHLKEYEQRDFDGKLSMLRDHISRTVKGNMTATLILANEGVRVETNKYRDKKVGVLIYTCHLHLLL